MFITFLSSVRSHYCGHCHVSLGIFKPCLSSTGSLAPLLQLPGFVHTRSENAKIKPDGVLFPPCILTVLQTFTFIRFDELCSWLFVNLFFFSTTVFNHWDTGTPKIRLLIVHRKHFLMSDRNNGNTVKSRAHPIDFWHQLFSFYLVSSPVCSISVTDLPFCKTGEVVHCGHAIFEQKE